MARNHILAMALVPVFVASQSFADDMTWTIISEYEYSVQVEFYSQDRNIAWPGNRKAFTINDYRAHEYPLQCISGETICYGAWPTEGDENGKYTKYWGVGAKNEQACSRCCAVCGDADPTFTLTK